MNVLWASLALAASFSAAQPLRRSASLKSVGGFEFAAAPEAAPAALASQSYVADPALSLTRFTLDTKIGKLAGSFKRYGATAVMDPITGALEAVAVTLDMKSVELDGSAIPHFLVEVFLKTGKYPTSDVHSLAVHPRSDGRFLAEIEVSARGETYQEPVVLAVERRGDNLRISGSVHHKTPKGNQGDLDFDLLFKKSF